MLPPNRLKNWARTYPKKGIYVRRIIRPSCAPRHTRTVYLTNEPPERPFEVSCNYDPKTQTFKYVGRLHEET